ncbi:MAG: glycosyltransferase family 2 protein [Ignavibacteria bacterium]|nr:glycosyltransferase family 2 protein [Ignavibacteria bacterium]
MADISIIIVNYNVKDLADNCISSAYKANGGKYELEIFFVDNYSVDGSCELISSKYPDVICIKNSQNLGFSKANNIALKLAKGEYILILNPDTVLEEGTFDKMIDFVVSNDNIGAVTSKLILGNGELDKACKRSFPTLSAALPRMLGLTALFPKSRLFGKYNLTYLDENKTHDVDSICGAFMFIPKKVLDETGYFDEDYFMYGEDIDLCYRIKQKGYRIIYYPEVTTVHLKGGSTSKTKFSYVNNFYGAMSVFVSKNFRESSKILILILKFGIFYRSLVSYIKRSIGNLIPFVLDAVLLFLSFIVSVNLRFNVFPNRPYLSIILVYVLVWLLVLSFFGAYLEKNKYSFFKTFNAIFVGFFVNSSITYFFKEYAFSREVVLMSTIWALIFLLGWRGILKTYRFFVDKNILLNKINLLVVSGKRLNQSLEEKFLSKYNILYYGIRESENLNFEDLKETIIIKNINEVLFSGDNFVNRDILHLMWDLKIKNVKFKIVPSEKELVFSKIRGDIENLGLVEIEYNINNKLNIFSKRLFDILLSFVLLILLYPFVRIYSVMVKNIGKFSSKILSLPAVFSGNLSFVGLPVWYNEITDSFLGKKGLTGILQIYDDGELSKEEINNLLIYYAKNQSLSLDLEIILKSFIKILKN